MAGSAAVAVAAAAEAAGAEPVAAEAAKPEADTVGAIDALAVCPDALGVSEPG